MNVKQFLQWGGGVLVLLGLLGMLGVIGPTPDQSLFGDSWWFDGPENWAHLVLGVVAIIASFVLDASMQRTLVMVVGVLALLVGLYGLVSSSLLLGANLESPLDDVLHLVVAAWAYLSMREKAA